MSAIKHIAVPALAASGAGTAVANPLDVGQAAGKSAVAVIHSPGGAFVGTVKLQGSDDNSSWSDLTTAQAMTAAGCIVLPIVGARYYRLNNTAYTSGSISASILS